MRCLDWCVVGWLPWSATFSEWEVASTVSVGVRFQCLRWLASLVTQWRCCVHSCHVLVVLPSPLVRCAVTRCFMCGHPMIPLAPLPSAWMVRSSLHTLEHLPPATDFMVRAIQRLFDVGVWAPPWMSLSLGLVFALRAQQCDVLWTVAAQATPSGLPVGRARLRPRSWSATSMMLYLSARCLMLRITYSLTSPAPGWDQGWGPGSVSDLPG